MTISKDFLEQLPGGLAKTGFLLEHEVAEAFGKAGWGVINNRFYVDDVDGKARELDLLVYRVLQGKEVEVVTTLLISCKKDKENAWVFMSRDRPKHDPNIDWNPVHWWSSNELLRTYLGSTGWEKSYVTSDVNLFNEIFDIKRLTFATQLFSKDHVTPQNQRPIFDSISGLMKAQDHEIMALPSRVKENRLYVINLLTIVDTSLVEAECSGSSIAAKEVDEVRHIARYIVRKKERTSRIHLVCKAQLTKTVNIYTKLAKYDQKYFNDAVVSAYESIKTNDAVRAYFSNILTRRLLWRFNASLSEISSSVIESDISIKYDNVKNELIILLPIVEDVARRLEKDPILNGHIKTFLRDIVRFNGKYRIEGDIPF